MRRGEKALCTPRMQSAAMQKTGKEDSCSVQLCEAEVTGLTLLHVPL